MVTVPLVQPSTEAANLCRTQAWLGAAAACARALKQQPWDGAGRNYRPVEGSAVITKLPMGEERKVTVVRNQSQTLWFRSLYCGSHPCPGTRQGEDSCSYS